MRSPRVGALILGIAASLLIGIGSAAAKHLAASLKVKPATVTHGKDVVLSGETAGRCKVGSKVTIYSSAFAGKPIFNGFQGVVVRSGQHRGFSATAKTNKRDQPGVWTIWARCGGKNFGITHLNVVA